MDRERIIILALVFASSHYAVYAGSKILTYIQQAIHIFKLLYTSNCTGTEFSIKLLKKFTLLLIFLVKNLFTCLDLQKVLYHDLCDAAISLCEKAEAIACFFWDGIIFLNCEIHHISSFMFGKWLPALIYDIITSIYNFIENWSYSSGLGSFAIILAVFILCSVLYFTFLIVLVIIRLYKLFLKPLIKMLTTLLNYRRQFVLRARRL